MEKNTYIKEISTDFPLKKLPSSKLVRSDAHLFTFSPIQDEIEHFKEGKRGIFYKEQICFRQVYPSNLVNPLATPSQNLISIFSFEERDYLIFINRILKGKLFEKIDFKDLYIIIPELDGIQEKFETITNQLIVLNQERLRCQLPLKGEHFYIKVCHLYHKGLVTLMNFVLVDYKVGSTLSKIDSVFFPMRMDMVIEGALSIFETSAYEKLYYDVYQITNQHELTHFFISQLSSISLLLEFVHGPSNNKQGYVIKKMVREIFLECDCNNLLVSDLLEYFPDLKEKLMTMYQDYSNSIGKALAKAIKNRNKLDAKYARETLGIPYKLYQLKIDSSYEIQDLPRNFAYHRDEKRNNHADPLESYK